jgi:hypothetical protein
MNDSTLEKVCRNAASTWTQSGHLKGRTLKKRRIVMATPATVAFAIYLAYAAGFRGAEIFSSAWLRVIDCDPSRARHLALDAKRIGLLDLRMAGDVVELNLSRLVMAAAKTWRRLQGQNQLPKVIEGVKFRDGIKVVPEAKSAA